MFGLFAHQSCGGRLPVLSLGNISFGYSKTGKRLFFPNENGVMPCKHKDKLAVAYLSNFSINNNYSHFLHGLLRLFCALLDARILLWDAVHGSFQQTQPYALWLDEYLKVNANKLQWFRSFGGMVRQLGPELKSGECVLASSLVYGSGCVKLLPPEKWFGYPGCRANAVLPAFGYFMRQVHRVSNNRDLVLLTTGHSNQQVEDPMQHLPTHYNDSLHDVKHSLSIGFAVRAVGDKTGKREISNLNIIQNYLRRENYMTSSISNITFEHLDVKGTVETMANTHILVSVHGAGMTNMFFMKSGTAIVEIIPFPLCHCQSKDFFYGDGGYYHGSAIAQGMKHYTYCVPSADTHWYHRPPEIDNEDVRCSWKYLHGVRSVHIDKMRFVALLRKVKRDLIASGTIILTSPVINMHAHANG